jgi:uncharacterized protein YkwD
VVACALATPGAAAADAGPLNVPLPAQVPVNAPLPDGPVWQTADCGPAADVDPSTAGVSVTSVRRATLCLLNEIRFAHGAEDLRFDRRLGRAALRHARDMVRSKYFAHTAPSGQTFLQRIRHTRYLRAPIGTHWSVGENLAWGRPAHATPRQIVDAWMHSPNHRSNILFHGFREIGIAIIVGSPVAAVPAATTYDTEFGVIGRC